MKKDAVGNSTQISPFSMSCEEVACSPSPREESARPLPKTQFVLQIRFADIVELNGVGECDRLHPALPSPRLGKN